MSTIYCYFVLSALCHVAIFYSTVNYTKTNFWFTIIAISYGINLCCSVDYKFTFTLLYFAHSNGLARTNENMFGHYKLAVKHGEIALTPTILSSQCPAKHRVEREFLLHRFTKPTRDAHLRRAARQWHGRDEFMRNISETIWHGRPF